MSNAAWKRTGAIAFVLAAIVLVATALRFHALGRTSLWYDEVVSMRLAEQPDAGVLLQRLGEIDATRAPLHPLVLQAWLRIFGPSDYAGRALSAVCGILTVLLVFRIGRKLFDAPTALWAAWLAALSPLFVRYSQEARMYAWLVMLTCLAWDRLLALRASATWPNVVPFVLCQVALVYSHPLGLLMLVAQAVAYLSCRRQLALHWQRWLASQALVALVALPWINHYLDHPPEFVTGRLPLKFLLGLPIGFTGGNAWTLLVCGAIVVWGLLKKNDATSAPDEATQMPGRSRTIVLDNPLAARVLLAWLIVPPALLYGYSWLAQPVFGSARYTLFVGPAYLLLLARGLVKLPLFVRYPAALAGVFLAGALLQTSVYAPDLKADWRAAAAVLESPERGPIEALVVLTEDPNQSFEAETARYYLGSRVPVLSMSAVMCDVPGLAAHAGRKWVVLSAGLRAGRPVVAVPPELEAAFPSEGPTVDVAGMRLIWRKARGEVKTSHGRSVGATGLPS